MLITGDINQLRIANRKSQIGTHFEDQARREGFSFIAGLDEVGRGCLAGSVVAAACILDPLKPLPEGLDDSKKLSADQREIIAEELKETVLAYSIAQIEAEEIDLINILEPTNTAIMPEAYVSCFVL